MDSSPGTSFSAFEIQFKREKNQNFFDFTSLDFFAESKGGPSLDLLEIQGSQIGVFGAHYI